MQLFDTPAVLLLVAMTAAALSAWIALVAWQHRPAAGALPMTLFGLAVAAWAAGFALELSSRTPPGQLFFARLRYLGILITPPAWLIFALQYSGAGSQLSRRRLAALAVEPLVLLPWLWSSDRHALLLRNASAPFRSGVLPFGPLFWLHIAYAGLLLLLSSALIARTLGQRRRHAASPLAILLASLLPWAAVAGALLRSSSLSAPDLPALAFALLGLASAWSLLRPRLQEILPVALDTIVHSLHDGVIVVDTHNRVVELNPAAQQLLGQAAPAVIGQPVDQLLASRGEILERYLNVAEGRESLMLRMGQPARFYALQITPLFGQRQRPAGRLLTLSDISEQRETEQLLYEAKKSAESASQAKTQLLAQMSHELRTPLTAILGYSKLLEDEVAERGQADLLPQLKHIAAAGSHLLDLVNDLLDLSKIEARRMELRLERFPISTLVREAVSAVKPQIELNGNLLRVHCDDETQAMRADQIKLRQVLINLLANAARYTQRGSITLDVNCEPPVLPEWVIFRVKDTGTGMTAEQRQSIFNSFSAQVGAPEKQASGTGLGLALSLQLCRLMGGDMSVESTLGHGSTFIVRMPVDVASRRPVPASAPASRRRASESQPSSGRGGRLLVIDDDEHTRSLLAHTLQRQGYVVITAQLGSEGLRLLDEQTFDLVLLDIMMPELSGYEVLAQIKAHPRGRQLPVVMISAIDDLDTILQCIKLGAEDYLFKPFNLTHLQQRVGVWVQKQRLREWEQADSGAARPDVLQERNRFETLLRVAEARYRELFEHANDVIYIHDLQGTLTALNYAGEQRLGYSRQEIIGKNINQLIASAYLPVLHEQLYAGLGNAGSARPLEIEFVCKDGSQLPVEVHARLIYAEGQPVGLTGICRDITERRQAERERDQLIAQLQALARIDEVTGLQNRRHFFELADREWSRARRFGSPLVAIMLDIDHFKRVNDTYGHMVGDQVLRAVAQRCLASIREVDILGRYGGEEFALLIVETHLQDALEVAERLRQTVADTPVPTSRGPVSVTLSLGVTEASEQLHDLTALLDRADAALYQAKQSGRNRVCVSPSPTISRQAGR